MTPAPALPPTVFPCYAPADRDAAVSIAAFLEAGAGVRALIEEGELRPGEDLVAKAREARMADVILVLFSRHSLPSPWPRSQWEAALKIEPAADNVRIAFLKCDDCAPPRVLTPQFDLAGLPIAVLRRLKRWVRSGTYTEPVIHVPELAEKVEALATAIADQPGVATVDRSLLAPEFARTFHQDFDKVIRLECGGRSLPALTGDLAAQLGLRLEGDLESNLEQLRNFCSDHRFLLWLEGASTDDAAQLSIGPRSSTLVSTELRAETPEDDESLRTIQYRLGHSSTISDWDQLCRFARLGVRLAAEQGRLAESFELLQQWHVLAESRADRRILEESAREMVWILEGWDRFEEARKLEFRRATQYDDQISLDISISVPPAPQLVRPIVAAPEKQDHVPMPRPEQLRLF